eukprot:300127-Pyramimonas_sp.AAC.1
MDLLDAKAEALQDLSQRHSSAQRRVLHRTAAAAQRPEGLAAAAAVAGAWRPAPGGRLQPSRGERPRLAVRGGLAVPREESCLATESPRARPSEAEGARTREQDRGPAAGGRPEPAPQQLRLA